MSDLSDLIGFIYDPDSTTRGMTATALGSINDRESVPPLVMLLSDSDRKVRIAAARSLGELGTTAKAAFEPLLTLLEDDDDELCVTVLAALAQLQDPRAFAPIVVRLFDVNDDIRSNAAAAIGCLGNLDALKPLLACLKDEYSQLRVNAAWSLGQLRLVEAGTALEETVRTDPDEEVRATALTALASMDSSAGTKLAFDFVGDVSPRVEIAALVVLGEHADELTLDQKSQMRLLCHKAIDESSDGDVCSTAVWSLGRLPYDSDTAKRLMELLQDSYFWTVAYAIESLSLMRAFEARPLLERMAEDTPNARSILEDDATTGHQDTSDFEGARLHQNVTSPDLSYAAPEGYQELAQQALAYMNSPEPLSSDV